MPRQTERGESLRFILSVPLIASAFFGAAGVAGSASAQDVGLPEQSEARLQAAAGWIDTDVDGLSDAEELALGTDPNRADSDGDLLDDAAELRLGFDPLLRDTYADGTLDGLRDSDGDGLGDAFELREVGTDPQDPDSDDDGLDDGAEREPGPWPPLPPIAIAPGDDFLVCDLDVDGRPDVVRTASNAAVWHRNLGGGRFEASHLSPEFVGTVVASADFDGDGDEDLVFHSAADRILGWVPFGMDGFSTPILIDDTIDGQNPTPADVDGDGDFDLVVGLEDGELGWFENVEGVFLQRPLGEHEFDETVPPAPAVIDFDGDGDLDVLVPRLLLFENLGGGELRMTRLGHADRAYPPAAGNAIRLFGTRWIADVDGDGDQDEVYRDTDEILFRPGSGLDPLDPDSDDDGVLDGAEVLIHGSDPQRGDSDGDGLGDFEEVAIHGSSPIAADSDGDSDDDPTEVAEGFDPADPLSFRPRAFQQKMNGQRALLPRDVDHTNDTLRFPFPFEGQEYRVITVSEDGWIALGSEIDLPPGAFKDLGPGFLEVGVPVISVLQTNLDTWGANAVRVGTLPGRAIISWDSHALAASKRERVSMQVQLLADGRILFGYSRLPASPSTGLYGGAVVGLSSGASAFDPGTLDLSPGLVGEAALPLYQLWCHDAFASCHDDAADDISALDLVEGDGLLFTPLEAGGFAWRSIPEPRGSSLHSAALAGLAGLRARRRPLGGSLQSHDRAVGSRRPLG